MDLDIGAIVSGKVNGITNFGAFVTVAPGKSGLVHISEISSTFVNDVRDHLTEGQDVVVKIIGLDKSGRMNLSIKAAAATANAPATTDTTTTTTTTVVGSDKDVHSTDTEPPTINQDTSQEPSFEDRLKRFMQDSNSKVSSLKRNSDKKNARRRSR
ncbi:MAG: S1 RNA-binding domain-containing protein [Oscillospiraceae bacterium]|nr:S1 RNA-binding domain-containing protein [Oscillospiraceae bacterium]